MRDIASSWAGFGVLSAAHLLASCSLLYQQESPSESKSDGGSVTADASSDAASSSVSFSLALPACGITEVAPSSVEIVGLEVAQLRWTLAYDTTTIMEVIGAPDDPIPSSMYVLGGSFMAPSFNLTPYRDNALGRLIRNSGTNSVFQQISLSPGDYVFEGVMMMPSGASIGGRVRNQGPDTTLYGPNTSYACDDGAFPCDALHYVKTPFSTTVALTATDPTSLLQLVFFQNGTFYIDGLKLLDASGNNLLDNASFESALDGNWGFSLDGGGFEPTPIPPALARYGDYSLSLRVIDSAGGESAAVTRTVAHQPCAAPSL